MKCSCVRPTGSGNGSEGTNGNGSKRCFDPFFLRYRDVATCIAVLEEMRARKLDRGAVCSPKPHFWRRPFSPSGIEATGIGGRSLPWAEDLAVSSTSPEVGGPQPPGGGGPQFVAELACAPQAAARNRNADCYLILNSEFAPVRARAAPLPRSETASPTAAMDDRACKKVQYPYS